MKIKIKNSNCQPLINSITVGPGNNQDLVYDAIKHMLKLYDYRKNALNIDDKCTKYIETEAINGIKLQRSLIPYRE